MMASQTARITFAPLPIVKRLDTSLKLVTPTQLQTPFTLDSLTTITSSNIASSWSLPLPSNVIFHPRSPDEQPVGILYRPPENKLKNAKPKDYLGKAKLVAAENANEAYTTFTGVTRMQQGYTPSGAPLDNGRTLGADVGGGKYNFVRSFPSSLRYRIMY
jgi:hypothetical protein